MEGFVTTTGRATRGGGSNHASSSRAAGKAPAIPQKRVSKASSSRKRKRPKTTTDPIEPEPLTYHESDPNPDSELELIETPAAEPSRIKLHGEWYRKASDIAGQRRGKKRSSHIWGDKKGFAIVHETSAVKYYYCCQCLDEKKDPAYKPLSKRLY